MAGLKLVPDAPFDCRLVFCQVEVDSASLPKLPVYQPLSSDWQELQQEELRIYSGKNLAVKLSRGASYVRFNID